MIDNSKDKPGPNVITSLVPKNSFYNRASSLTDTQRVLAPVVTCINSWNCCGIALSIMHGYHPKAVCVLKF